MLFFRLAALSLAMMPCVLGCSGSVGQPKAQDVLGQTLEWFLGAWTDNPESSSSDSAMLLRVAGFEANTQARNALVVLLGQVQHGDRRSLAAVALAGFMHDPDSARALMARIGQVDDPLRREMIMALTRRHERLPSETSMELMKSSKDTFVRQMALELAYLDENAPELYRQGLADGETAVRSTVFTIAPHEWWMRALAKQWLRQRLKGFSGPKEVEDASDIEACLKWLRESYGLRETADLIRGGRVHQASRVLFIADQVDGLTADLGGTITRREGEVP